MFNGCGQKRGRFLLDRACRSAIGAHWEPTTAVPTLAETVVWARSIPKAAREAQGFTRVLDFARQVKQLREERAKLRAWHPDPVRRDLLDKLQRIMDDRKDLTITARRIARFWWKPRMYVWWCGGVPKAHDGVRLEHGVYYEKRNVVVPAAWLLAHLGTGNIAKRMRLALRKQRENARKERQRKATVRHATEPSAEAPDTLGWRGWRLKGGLLVSPLRNTPWLDSTLRAERWSDCAAVCGAAGIHARRLPRDWRQADPGVTEIGRCDVHGIVERFGRYVLGTEGWRAEWAAIRELMAPDARTASALMRRYPEVKVHIRAREASDGHR
jgi:hypothetical protein